jgi:hypothetical protein
VESRGVADPVVVVIALEDTPESKCNHRNKNLHGLFHMDMQFAEYKKAFQMHTNAESLSVPSQGSLKYPKCLEPASQAY